MEKEYIKIAEEITDKIISLWNHNSINGRSFYELCDLLLDEKYKENSKNIFVYIPQLIYKKGYDIITSKPLELKITKKTK